MRASLLALIAGSLTINAACNDVVVAKPPCREPSSGSVSRIRVARLDKLDVLFVVDNSISMADKQSELSRQIPTMLAALTDPAPDPVTGRPLNLLDIHVGVITSSLGSHGTSACATELTNPTNNDRGHLLPRPGETSCTTAVTSSPLTWVYKPEADPGAAFKGAEGAARLAAATSCVVSSAREQGCGYEETWEAMYHFLVDPAPYAKAEVKCTFGDGICGNNKILIEGVDEALLAQRKAFLRPDSLLAVIILSDENDASLKPAGLNWLPWGYAKGQMQRGWAGCDSVPDDFEPDTAADFVRLHDEFKCWSCFEKTTDPNCSVKWATDPLNNDVDGRNLRAMRMTNRFGYNFLWGRQRYVDAFTKPQVFGSDKKLASNPVFSGGFRTQDLIVVATIVGVPPHLVANGDGTAKELTAADWDLIQGPLGKRDPHMFEQIKPRTQAGPDGKTIPKFAGDRWIDPIHGGDRDIPDGDDLQYACIGKRATMASSDDCDGVDAHLRNPLCGPGNTQPYFKAYPGLRHLRIAKDLGLSGFVASICSESYQPAIRGMTEKLRAVLTDQCLRTSLVPEPDGRVNCMLVEAMREGTDAGKRCEELGKGLCTPGAAPCRREGTSYPPMPVEKVAAQTALPIAVIDVEGGTRTEFARTFVANGNVYVEGSDRRRHPVCELEQFSGAELLACINEPTFTVDPAVDGGFCYSQVPEVVGAQCKKLGSPGTIRFFGGATPRNGSQMFTFCGGELPPDPGTCE